MRVGDEKRPALSAWETKRSGPLTALTWTSDVQLVTMIDAVTPGLMARRFAPTWDYPAVTGPSFTRVTNVSDRPAMVPVTCQHPGLGQTRSLGTKPNLP
jgi:hypothetical protein